METMKGWNSAGWGDDKVLMDELMRLKTDWPIPTCGGAMSNAVLTAEG